MGKIDDYIAKRRGSSSDVFVFSIQLLDAYENLLQEIDIEDVVSGTVNITEQNGSRRNAVITFNNSTGIYKPDPNGLVWLDNKFLIKTGIFVDDEAILFDQGIFTLGEVNVTGQQSDKQISYQLLDKFSFLDGTISGKLENEIYIPNGTNLATAISSIFIEANSQQYLINYTNKPLIVDPIATTIPYTATENEGSTFYSLIRKLLEPTGLDIFFDRSGYPRLQTPTDLDNDAPVYEFEEFDELKLGTSLKVDYTKVRNRGRVTGDSWVDGTKPDANDSIADVSNPLRVARIGGRQFFVKGDAITKDSEALVYLNALLEQNQRVPETANIQFLNLDFADVGDIVNVTESGLDLEQDRYKIRQLNIPLIQTNSTMTADVERTVSL